MPPGKSSVPRETGVILLMAVFLALIYNFFSARPLPLVRTEPLKIATPDSLLFSAGRPVDTARIREILNESERQRPVGAVAPLHQRALANPESVAAVAQKQAGSLFRIVSLPQLRRLLAEHRGLFIDARTAEEFRKGHIRGSHNIPGEDISPHFPEIAPLPRDTLIVVYCTGPLCNLGRMVADFLHVMEFSNVVLYDDGWEGWERAKLDRDTVLTATGEI